MPKKKTYGEPLPPVETELAGTGPRLFARARRVENARAAIVVLHGICEHSGRLDELTQGLAERGFSTFAVDLRGHGRSEDAPGGREGRRVHVERFDDYLEDVERALAWARAEEPGKPLFLFGHSMGGLIVLRYGLLNPDTGVTGLIAASPALRMPLWKELGARFVATPVVALTGGRFHVGEDPISKRSIGRSLSRVAEVRTRFFADELVHVGITLRLIVEVVRAGRDVLARAASLRLPILILHGRADPVTDPEGSQRFREFRSSHTTTCFYPGALHELHNELEETRLEELADIERWIEDRLAAIEA